VETPLKGRQAEARRNDSAILEAARSVFASKGSGASVADVATAASVGVASLYRRFETKEALLEHLCLVSLQQQVEAADRAKTIGDPWSGFSGFVSECVELRIGAFAVAAGTFDVTPHLEEAALTAHKRTEALVRRAQRSNRLRADVSARDVLDLIEVFSRRQPEARYERPLAIALDGLRARGRTVLPSSPPRWDDDQSRWLRPTRIRGAQR
jgi:AcrR family transcriptional regulator